ncbi:hypothetical protein O6H91_19G004200 [Diphasiastrum complanatum]|uniref:Uncharacterized protein n=1 Tax=Diphasiastrum complanatum TaxID=34168 RepID=A0ACC2AS84_DIPCM|nr:hypothetical protein O6H91_19G004200 [Diphasiastrum complanatum]
MATMQVSNDNAVHTVLGIYRPKPGYTANEVLESTIKHYGAVEDIKEFLIAAIVKSLDNAYAGSYAHWKKGTDIGAVFQLPGLVPMLTEMGALADIEPVELEVLPETSDAPILSKGDILHIALLTTEPENQQKLIETLHATIKPKTKDVESLKSVKIHRSLDGKKVVVIGVWKDPAFDQAAASSPLWEEEEVSKTIDQYVISKDVKFYEVVLVR